MLWQTAWILATSPDPSVRDGARAVELASRAVQLSGGQEPRAFDALAAALAETEKFSAAVEAAEQASAMALARDDDALADAIDAADSPLPPGLAVSPAGSRPCRPIMCRRQRISRRPARARSISGGGSLRGGRGKQPAAAGKHVPAGRGKIARRRREKPVGHGRRAVVELNDVERVFVPLASPAARGGRGATFDDQDSAGSVACRKSSPAETLSLAGG